MSAAVRTFPLIARVLAFLFFVVTTALGVISIAQRYVPGRMTKLGYAGPLDGSTAVQFGVCIVLLGFMPLMLLAKSPRLAAWFGSSLAVLLLLNLLFGARLWH